MNSQGNVIEMYKNEEKEKYVVKILGRCRHQSQFTNGMPNMSYNRKAMNDKC